MAVFHIHRVAVHCAVAIPEQRASVWTFTPGQRAALETPSWLPARDHREIGASQIVGVC